MIQYNIINGQSNLLYSMIYSFHMPLFMFICGYVLEKFIKISSFKNSFSFIYKKGRVLLLPLFSWAVLRTIFGNSLDNTLPYKIYEAITSQIFQPNLWFLHTLFELMLFYIIFYWLSMLINKSKNIFIDFFLILVQLGLLIISFKFIFNQSLDMSFVLYLIFFFTGVLIIRYNFLLNLIINKNINQIALLLFVILIGNYSFIQHDLSIMKIYKIIISFLAVIVLYNFVQEKLLNNNLINDFIIRCGKSSLAIYIIHFSFVDIYSLQYNANLFSLFFFTLIVSILIIFPIFYIEKGIKKNKYISLFLLGTPIKEIH